MYLAGLIVLLASAAVHGYGGGAPDTVCDTMTPSSASNTGHGATPTTSGFPYEVTFSKDCIKAGDTVDGKYHPAGRALTSD